MDRFWKGIIVAFVAVFLGRIALDGFIAYKAATDSPKVLDSTTCIVKLVKS